MAGMRSKQQWINLSLLNLACVAFLGMIMRSKMLFSLPFIDFPHLLNAHSHFAFGSWVTLALMTLMLYDLLPPEVHSKRIYQWLLGGVFITSWAMLISFFMEGYAPFSIFFSTLFIFVTYAFSWNFIRDLRKAEVSKNVRLVSISALVCLILSSLGPFTLAYLLATKYMNFFLYRDATFTYLHLNYNGFFTLGVFALLFNKIESKVSEKAQHKIRNFSRVLVISVVPSLFLSYLWQDPKNILLVFAILGSILVIISLIWFIRMALSIRNIGNNLASLIKTMGIVSMLAFTLKMMLQWMLIFDAVGDKVFGNRTMIIGYLHLVFLVFVTLFILAYITQIGLLDRKRKITTVALVLFMMGVVLNEAILMGQGLGAMFFISSNLFSIMLWITSIWMFASAVLIIAGETKRPVSATGADLKS